MFFTGAGQACRMVAVTHDIRGIRFTFAIGSTVFTASLRRAGTTRMRTLFLLFHLGTPSLMLDHAQCPSVSVVEHPDAHE
jgi:hypothetical protein